MYAVILVIVVIEVIAVIIITIIIYTHMLPQSVQLLTLLNLF